MDNKTCQFNIQESFRFKSLTPENDENDSAHQLKPAMYGSRKTIAKSQLSSTKAVTIGKAGRLFPFRLRTGWQ